MIDKQLNREALDEHNRLRALHGCPPLQYDERLARDAQSWAENLARLKILKHSICDEYGENLATSMSTNKATMSGSQATQNWYNEIHQHNFDQQYQSGTGHFTQVIWKSTTKAGFGIQHSTDGHHVFIVGRYVPAGNVQGKFKENVPRPNSRRVSTPKSKVSSQNRDTSNVNGPQRNNRDRIIVSRPTNAQDNANLNHIRIVHCPERTKSEETILTNNNKDVITIYRESGNRVERQTGVIKTNTEVNNKNQKEPVYVVPAKKRSQRKCAKKCSIM
uniref:SJCHGC08973 protein n=1 Tax=Schistosoma japonicum TaxID=6182 RepID=Q5DGP9_SCHJA|nr:SJCHGC08973 protein [Schistosoma japonicum]